MLTYNDIDLAGQRLHSNCQSVYIVEEDGRVYKHFICGKTLADAIINLKKTDWFINSSRRIADESIERLAGDIGKMYTMYNELCKEKGEFEETYNVERHDVEIYNFKTRRDINRQTKEAGKKR